MEKVDFGVGLQKPESLKRGKISKVAKLVFTQFTA